MKRDKNEQLRIENAEYANEITELRTVNEELLMKIDQLKSGSSSTTDSNDEEADRNAELEEMMVTQRREILWLKKEMESQTAELTSLRKEVHELKRERRKNSKLIDRQKRTINESVDRVQSTLRSLL